MYDIRMKILQVISLLEEFIKDFNYEKEDKKVKELISFSTEKKIKMLQNERIKIEKLPFFIEEEFKLINERINHKASFDNFFVY